MESVVILIERLVPPVVIPHLPRPQPTRTLVFGATLMAFEAPAPWQLETVRDFA